MPSFGTGDSAKYSRILLGNSAKYLKLYQIRYDMSINYGKFIRISPFIGLTGDKVRKRCRGNRLTAVSDPKKVTILP
jgi:hypothetical protein